MKRCIELAYKAIGNTYPNPLVGSVIVHQNRILAEGYHTEAGKPHAEISAINSVDDQSLFRNSTIYVSLEPCSHYGRTPPCSLKIRELGFKKVVIGIMDSHEKVNGKGKKILKDAGIEVISRVLEESCRVLNKRFFTFHEKKRPYIILKWAESMDGFIDKDYHPFSISNALVKQWVHKMRAEENAVLVGTNTALRDNPSLTVREISGKNPVRLVVDFDLKIPSHFNIYDRNAQTYVFNKNREGNIGNIKYIKTSRENFVEDFLKKLYENSIQSVIIEGGAFTLREMIKRGLWDEAFVIKAPSIFLENGTLAPEISSSVFAVKEIRDNIIYHYKNDL